MLKKLVILGTSGNAYDVLDVVEAINTLSATWSPAGFLDDGKRAGEEHLGMPVLGGLADASKLNDCWFINAIGSDASYRRRPELVAATRVDENRFATLVHPKANVSSRAFVGRGVLVNYGVSIAGNARVQDHASIGPGCIIGHDSVIGVHAVLAAGAVVSGLVQVGRASYIGASSVIRQRIRIGEGALVGMGAVVINDVVDGTTVVGNPARLLVRGARVKLSATG